MTVCYSNFANSNQIYGPISIKYVKWKRQTLL